MKKLLGFTLTELMIAITVLGILTAAVLPAVLGNNPNQNKVMIKKAYFTTAEVVSEMINNESLFARFDSDGNDYALGEYGNRNVGILNNGEAVDFDGINTSNYDRKKIIIFSRMINPKQDYDKNNASGKYDHANCYDINPGGFDWYTTTTKDGMVWCMADKDSILKLMVDVNGDKKPNCYQGMTWGNCVGRTENFDQFRMDVYPDGAIVINPNDEWAKEALTVGSSLSD